MCLSNTYKESDRSLLMTNTSRITEEEGVLTVRDLFGDTVRVRGVITAVDFEANTVVIRTEE